MIDHHATEMELIARARSRAEAVWARCSPGLAIVLVPMPRSDGTPPPRTRTAIDRARG